ncbi:Uncharacterised protein [Legionella busanensis]|uniref:Uncharacterized protein n=1 Tax=Legionella busanensis TaxID=190655 RepID=A0A378JMU6_9GAMM|nr:hypothetical protein [Legionella busanensis]STX52397.1 Uncharacterised protein [Legionella busanensis]
MHYYFNTPDQIAGDEAYNELNFTKALTHYNRALQTLNHLASQRKFKRNNDYRYALTYVICEIVQTKCDAIKEIIENQEIFNFDSLRKLWTEIPGLINELESVFNEMGDKGKDAIKERIEVNYKLLAEVCDLISEELSDGLEDESLQESDILSALSWLTRSIDYFKRANLPIQMELHLGYLNLLEKAYKCNSDKNHLLQITQYIINNKLLDLPLTSTQALEMLSYQLLVAIKSNDSSSAKYLIKKFGELSSAPDIDRDNYILDDIQSLIDKFTDKQEDDSVKKRKFSKADKISATDKDHYILEDTESLSEKLNAQEKNDSVKKRRLRKADKTSLIAEDGGEAEVIKNSSKQAKNVILEDTGIEEMNVVNQTTENIPTPMNAQPSYPKDLPSVSQTIDRTFFGKNTKTAKKVSFKENDYSYVSPFIKTFEKLSEQFANPEFLANILCLNADFYNKTALPIKNTRLLSRELYESALLIVPNHPVASVRKNINHATIRDNNHYGSQSSFTTDKNPKAIFIEAIEALTMQLEAFTADNIEKINGILNSNVSFVTNNIVSKNIAGRQSAEIAKQIQGRYHYLSTHERNNEQQVPSEQQESLTFR